MTLCVCVYVCVLLHKCTCWNAGGGEKGNEGGGCGKGEKNNEKDT